LPKNQRSCIAYALEHHNELYCGGLVGPGIIGEMWRPPGRGLQRRHTGQAHGDEDFLDGGGRLDESNKAQVALAAGAFDVDGESAA